MVGDTTFECFRSVDVSGKNGFDVWPGRPTALYFSAKKVFGVWCPNTSNYKSALQQREEKKKFMRILRKHADLHLSCTLNMVKQTCTKEQKCTNIVFDLRISLEGVWRMTPQKTQGHTLKR